MNRQGKYLTIISIVFVSLSIPVGLTCAVTLSAPHYTVNIIDGSFTSPVTHSTDPYTGQTSTQGGSTIQTRDISFVIENVPQANYYLIQYRGHYSTSTWTSVAPLGINVTASASSGSQTIVTISGSNPQQSSITDPFYWGDWIYNFAPNSVIDFRVQAVSGSESHDPLFGYSANHPIIVGTASSWSIQTINLSTGEILSPTSETLSPTNVPNSTPSQTPLVPEFPAKIALTFLSLTALAIAVVSRRKHLTRS
jgi:hypothetical protein